MRPESPLSMSPVFGLDFTKCPPCDRCQRPVPRMNSAIEYDVRFDVWTLPPSGGGRHILRVMINGETICVGSPSRAQTIYDQPRDDRKSPNNLSKQDVQNGRDAFYSARFRDAEVSGRLTVPFDAREACPGCGGQAPVHYWGSYREYWIIQMHCPACDPEDSVRPILAIPRDRSSDQGARILDPLSIGLLGLGALRMPFDRAKRIDYEPPPDDMPE